MPCAQGAGPASLDLVERAALALNTLTGTVGGRAGSVVWRGACQERDLLELEYCRDAGDWGKPVPVAFADGECFAVDYFGNGMPVGSDALAWLHPDRGHNCYVNGYRFRLEDLPAPALP